MNDIYDTLMDVFRELFEDETIQLNENTTANDVEGWDSLSHSLVILAVEKRFKIKFTQREILGFANVGGMAECIHTKLENPG